MLKKIGIVLAVILVVLAAFFIYFYFQAQKMVSMVATEYAKVGKVDLSRIADGVYTGSFDNFLVASKVEVTVKNHKIEQVKVVEQRSAKGYEASDLPNRIVAAQSPKVDAVTGATGSSKCIMIAVDRALSKRK